MNIKYYKNIQESRLTEINRSEKYLIIIFYVNLCLNDMNKVFVTKAAYFRNININ